MRVQVVGQTSKNRQYTREGGQAQTHEARIRLVTDTHKEQPVGVTHALEELKKDSRYSHDRAYRILKKNGTITAPAVRSKRRKWIDSEHTPMPWYTDSR